MAESALSGEGGGMNAAASRVISIPTGKRFEREAKLDRDVEALVDVFRELHEVERMTGRTGLSARVRLSIFNIIMSAYKFSQVNQ